MGTRPVLYYHRRYISTHLVYFFSSNSSFCFLCYLDTIGLFSPSNLPVRINRHSGFTQRSPRQRFCYVFPIHHDCALHSMNICYTHSIGIVCIMSDDVCDLPPPLLLLLLLATTPPPPPPCSIRSIPPTFSTTILTIPNVLLRATPCNSILPCFTTTTISRRPLTTTPTRFWVTISPSLSSRRLPRIRLHRLTTPRTLRTISTAPPWDPLPTTIPRPDADRRLPNAAWRRTTILLRILLPGISIRSSSRSNIIRSSRIRTPRILPRRAAAAAATIHRTRRPPLRRPRPPLCEHPREDHKHLLLLPNHSKSTIIPQRAGSHQQQPPSARPESGHDNNTPPPPPHYRYAPSPYQQYYPPPPYGAYHGYPPPPPPPPPGDETRRSSGDRHTITWGPSTQHLSSAASLEDAPLLALPSSSKDDEEDLSPPSPPQVFRASPSPPHSFAGLIDAASAGMGEFSPMGPTFASLETGAATVHPQQQPAHKLRLSGSSSSEGNDDFARTAFGEDFGIPPASRTTTTSSGATMPVVQPRNLWLEAPSSRGAQQHQQAPPTDMGGGEASNVRRLTIMGGPGSTVGLEGINSMMRESSSSSAAATTLAERIANNKKKKQAARKRKKKEPKPSKQEARKRPAESEGKLSSSSKPPPSQFLQEQAYQQQQSMMARQEQQQQQQQQHGHYHPSLSYPPPGFGDPSSPYQQYPYPSPHQQPYGRPTDSAERRPKLPPTFEPPRSSSTPKQPPPTTFRAHPSSSSSSRTATPQFPPSSFRTGTAATPNYLMLGSSGSHQPHSGGSSATPQMARGDDRPLSSGPRYAPPSSPSGRRLRPLRLPRKGKGEHVPSSALKVAPTPTPTAPPVWMRGKEFPAAQDESEESKRPKCNCKKSKCLKMYCECFSNKLFCEGCNCSDCNNNERFAAVRDKALNDAISKNKAIFEQRSAGQTAGCRCKRSECLKKYCEVTASRIVTVLIILCRKHASHLRVLFSFLCAVLSSWCYLQHQVQVCVLQQSRRFAEVDRQASQDERHQGRRVRHEDLSRVVGAAEDSETKCPNAASSSPRPNGISRGSDADWDAVACSFDAGRNGLTGSVNAEWNASTPPPSYGSRWTASALERHDASSVSNATAVGWTTNDGTNGIFANGSSTTNATRFCWL